MRGTVGTSWGQAGAWGAGQDTKMLPGLVWSCWEERGGEEPGDCSPSASVGGSHPCTHSQSNQTLVFIRRHTQTQAHTPIHTHSHSHLH